MEWTDQTRFVLADGVSFQSMGPGEDAVLLSIDSGYVFTCNETTASFLGALNGERTFAQAVDVLEQEYDVPRKQLRRDLKELVEQLLEERLLVIPKAD